MAILIPENFMTFVIVSVMIAPRVRHVTVSLLFSFYIKCFFIGLRAIFRNSDRKLAAKILHISLLKLNCWLN